MFQFTIRSLGFKNLNLFKNPFGPTEDLSRILAEAAPECRVATDPRPAHWLWCEVDISREQFWQQAWMQIYSFNYTKTQKYVPIHDVESRFSKYRFVSEGRHFSGVVPSVVFGTKTYFSYRFLPVSKRLTLR
jgi:hypothetical protein